MRFDLMDWFLLGMIIFFILLGITTATVAYKKGRSYFPGLTSIFMAGLFTILFAFKLYHIADAQRAALDATITKAWYHPEQGNHKDNPTDLTITFNDQIYRYQGNIVSFAANGQGEAYDDQDNLILAGTFRDNQLHGAGVWYRPDGTTRYSGHFRYNQLHGKGITYDTLGNIAINGTYRNGKLHGEVYHYQDGKVHTFSKYENGKRVKILRQY
ncbi:toxin-antitoxin system YwqK family antitoxin [Paenibacillus assamensis]|uniref:toxin-antitoxin system YwqK family antitoxin n=1 Tax=Paenibacillus assamensis TaxID=311244 RepID=UPI000416A1F3|nr:hypothetical protein [Paenibacillus assamensis]